MLCKMIIWKSFKLEADVDPVGDLHFPRDIHK